MFQAQLEAAEAKAELAQLALDRLTLRAPFAGRITALPVSAGQYVLKGTVIAELADVTGLKSLVPVDRRTAAEGRELKIYVEEQEQTAKVQSILPLPEAYAHLHELAAPFAAAWINVPNDKGELAPGLRVRSATLPVTPIATIPREAVKTAEASKGSGGAIAQVIRNEYVTNVPVEVLGKVGPERVQVTGAFRPTDALIVSSSVPAAAGHAGAVLAVAQPGHRGHHAEPRHQGCRGGDHAARAGSRRRCRRRVPPPRGPRRPPGSRPSTRRPTAPAPAAGQGQGDAAAVLTRQGSIMKISRIAAYQVDLPLPRAPTAGRAASRSPSSTARSCASRPTPASSATARSARSGRSTCRPTRPASAPGSPSSGRTCSAKTRPSWAG